MARREDDDPWQPHVILGGKSDQPGRVRLLGMADILAAPQRDYIVKGWLSPAETSLIVGAKNARKTFVALHTAYGIAQGRPRLWGRRVKQCPAAYIICEGIAGLSLRVQALRAKFGDCSAFYAIAQPLDLLRGDGDLPEVIEHIKRAEAGVTFIDTVAQVMQGGRENDPEDMGIFSSNLLEIAYQTGSHVSGVHHGTKAEGTSSRGHSVLPNAAGAIAGIEWNDETGCGIAALQFARDDITGMLGGFRTEVIELGRDADGDRLTSLVIEETTPEPKPEQTPRGGVSYAMLAKRILAELMIDGAVGHPGVPPGFRSVTRTAWRNAFFERTMADAKTNRTAFTRGADTLITRCQVGVSGERVWLCYDEKEI